MTVVVLLTTHPVPKVNLGGFVCLKVMGQNILVSVHGFGVGMAPEIKL